MLLRSQSLQSVSSAIKSKEYISVWWNGITPGLGPGSEGSIPSIETNKEIMAGKGDKQRPTDHVAYASNYDAIFGKKTRDLCNGSISDFDSESVGSIPASCTTDEKTDLNQSVE